MARLRALWRNIIESLWFLPALATVAAVLLARWLVGVEATDLLDGDDPEAWWLFGAGAEGARGVLSAIAGSLITVTGVVFSVTIVALQLASQQFTPRVLRHFMADRANQSVLAVFIGTFTYALLVMRTVRGASEERELFVPEVAVTAAVALALLCIAFLIFFIDHVARSIQVSVILDRVTADTMRVLAHTFPGDRTAPADAAVPSTMPPSDIHADSAGYLQALTLQKLVKIARDHDLLLRLEAQPGDFLLPGQLLARVWSGKTHADAVAKEVCAAVHLGPARTPHQDLRFGVIELVDIALKGLSPSINDPTTAMNVIDRLGQVLHALAAEPQADSVIRDDDGVIRVLMPRPTLDVIMRLAIDQVRLHGANQPAVVTHLVNMLSEVARLSPESTRPLFARHIEQVRASALDRLTTEADRSIVERTVREALEGMTSG